MYGIFGKTTLAYTIDREEEGVLQKQPTLPQLTQAAIGILNPDPDGFFVMIEGGSNDWGGHSRDAAWVGAEIRELDQAVKLAYDWAVEEKAATGHETLIILEADHETGGLIVGPSTKYPLIAKQTASTEWMWGLIKAARCPSEDALHLCGLHAHVRSDCTDPAGSRDGHLRRARGALPTELGLERDR